MARPQHRPIIINVAVFIALEVASLCILTNNSELQKSWLGQGFHNAMGYIWSGTGSISRLINLSRENERLWQENMALMQAAERTRAEIAEQPGQWKPLRVRYSLLDATVVTISTGSQHNYLIIDRGQADGVEVEDGIITDRGVIGVVQSVSEHFAYAISSANQDMAISARLGREGLVGSLRWDGGDNRNSILGGIPIHTDINPGDTVFTSGFSSIFPSGIPLGEVVDKVSSNGSSADIRIRMFEDYSRVCHVTVVKNNDRKELKELENESL